MTTRPIRASAPAVEADHAEEKPRSAEGKPRPQSEAWTHRVGAMWRRFREMLRPPRTIRPTRSGFAFIGLTLFIGFAALNTGNNLLYLILGMMLSLIGVSGILSEFSMRSLTARRQVPREMVAGEDGLFTLQLINRKRLLPAIAIWVEEQPTPALKASPAHFVYTGPRGEVSARARYRFNRRGLFNLSQVLIYTTYPFGLFRRSFPCKIDDEVLVFPQIEAVVPGRGTGRVDQGDLPRSAKGLGEEFFGLRSFSQGDDPRRIHWKSSAKRATLLMWETSAQQRRRVRIKLELTNPLPEEVTYEQGLVKVVSYAAHFLDLGYEVGVDLPGEAVPYETDHIQLRRILRAVALAPRAAEAAEKPPSTLRWPPAREVLIQVVGQELTVEDSS